jgi:NADH:ubiquinone oxidoreductase subunit F (NADH-binding)
VVVANGCEGDPASDKDHALLTLVPHLVLDGIELAARAVGATETLLCLHQDDGLVNLTRSAIAERPASSLLPRLVEVPARYVASADTALVNFLNTGDARPAGRTPRPSQRGVNARPTLVDNVETLAHLALIARYGPDWFRIKGTQDAPGTTLVTVSGAVHRPGVYEIDLGAPLSHPLRLAGGTSTPAQAVLLGGLGGRWLPLPAMAGLSLTDQACRKVGVRLGIAALIALPIGACGLAATATILRYLADQSARQCGPCMFGLPAIAADMIQIATAAASQADVERLRRRVGIIPGRGACAHPDGAAALAASALQVFADDLSYHLGGQPCPASKAPFPLPISDLTEQR